MRKSAGSNVKAESEVVYDVDKSLYEILHGVTIGFGQSQNQVVSHAAVKFTGKKQMCRII